MLSNSHFLKTLAKLCVNEVIQDLLEGTLMLGLKWYEFWEGAAILQLRNYARDFIQQCIFLNPPGFCLQFTCRTR